MYVAIPGRRSQTNRGSVLLRLRGRMAVGVDRPDEWLDRLEERELWLLVLAAPACDCDSSLFSCSGRMIASSMSPIT